MWWELGDHLATILGCLGLTEQRLKRLFRCRCGERRAWLNEHGEAFYAWLFPVHHRRLTTLFETTVGYELRASVLSESEIYDTVSLLIRVGRSTVGRWLRRMAAAGQLAAMERHSTVSGEPVVERIYSLPPECGAAC